MLKTIAFQISDTIDTKAFKDNYTGELLSFDADELFYGTPNSRYIYIVKYGAVAFLGYSDTEMSQFISFLKEYCENPLENRLREEFIIETNAKADRIGHAQIALTQFDDHVVKIIMLNVAQSVAVDYYAKNAENLLNDTKKFTGLLEKTGSLTISGRKLKRYIGKTINLKSRIAENIYIFNSPPEAWENEYLSRIDLGMKKAFDLHIRNKNIQEDLNLIKENLDLFKDLLQHRNASTLEWIIIILILVEVVNMFIEKF
ncbi:MAG TPA: hypothetical protein DCQ31_07835 [Bacteroidales bacterium]|nr:hypothetical protein [Bacteroidales bacterium]